MKRWLALGLAALLTGGILEAQSPNTPLVRALSADPVQANYLSRHPEILRWIAKHPDQTPRVIGRTATADEKAKNNAINEWIVAQPNLALLLAKDPDQALAWADNPSTLADLAKKKK